MCYTQADTNKQATVYLLRFCELCEILFSYVENVLQMNLMQYWLCPVLYVYIEFETKEL